MIKGEKNKIYDTLSKRVWVRLNDLPEPLRTFAYHLFPCRNHTETGEVLSEKDTQIKYELAQHPVDFENSVVELIDNVLLDIKHDINMLAKDVANGKKRVTTLKQGHEEVIKIIDSYITKWK